MSIERNFNSNEFFKTYISEIKDSNKNIAQIIKEKESFKHSQTFENTGKVNGIAVLPNGKVASIFESGIKIWNPETTECIRTFKVMNPSCIAALSEDSVIVGAGNNLKICNVLTGEINTIYTRYHISCIGIISDEYVISGWSNIFYIWHLPTRRCEKKLETEKNDNISFITVLPGEKGEKVLAGYKDKILKIWAGQQKNA